MRLPCLLPYCCNVRYVYVSEFRLDGPSLTRIIVSIAILCARGCCKQNELQGWTLLAF